jgi:hypothetical protein|tara:strand:- start:436 stop:624 length:189 start_codon:yes stop_codon:yes gene_type:complete
MQNSVRSLPRKSAWVARRSNRLPFDLKEKAFSAISEGAFLLCGRQQKSPAFLPGFLLIRISD